MKSWKKSGQSFSDVVLGLRSRMQKKPLSEFFGAWPGTNEESLRIKKQLEQDRKRFRTEEVVF